MTDVASASLATLRLRAQILAQVRAFFAQRSVLEVDTPALSSAGISDPALESITATVRSLGARPYFLQTSPEYAMKRLLAAGSGDIYQVCRVFRDDELGRWHQPEFTLLEWYRVGWDDVQLMAEVEELLNVVLASPAAASGAAGERQTRRCVRIRYADALCGCLGLGPHAPTAALVEQLRLRGIDVPANLAHDAVLDLAFGVLAVPSFDADALTFVYDYPASQAALARIKPGTPSVAARFEAFSRGIELANGFHELTDAEEQRRRFVAELDTRRKAGRQVPPLDERLLAALAQGLPACAGVALGLDRLVALAAGLTEVAAAISFAHSGRSDH
jgi:lysyl-tRNA synthetase class 2